jgi:hypothetical protein
MSFESDDDEAPRAANSYLPLSRARARTRGKGGTPTPADATIEVGLVGRCASGTAPRHGLPGGTDRTAACGETVMWIMRSSRIHAIRPSASSRSSVY